MIDRQLDQQIRGWLEADAPNQIPERVLRATAARTRRTHQGRWRAITFHLGINRMVALGGVAAAIVLVVAGAAGLNLLIDRQPGVGAASPSPSTTTASPEPSPGPSTSGGMWPQSTLEEVEVAQELADAGDPDHAWQVDPQLSEDIAHSFNPEDSTFVSRFLRERLGWEEFSFNPHVGWDELYSNLVFVRCAPGGTNALYPADGQAGSCAPTLDDIHYEAVRLSLRQPGREGPTGIWVVSEWRMTTPFAQTDPVAAEAAARARLEQFLKARVDGQGAEGYVDVVAFESPGMTEQVPLLYATTAGDRYERYEIDRVGDPAWPFARMNFAVRLFAHGGQTVVEQQIHWDGTDFTHHAAQTTENGEPVAARYVFYEGLVSMSAALPWDIAFERHALDLDDEFWEAIVVVADPRAVGGDCRTDPPAVDAADLAATLRSDPGLDVTAPIDAILGGVDALQLDVALAPGRDSCEGAAVLRLPDDSDRRGANLDHDTRMRLYLVGLGSRVVAIAITAPEARFDEVVAAAEPVMDSIEFTAP